MCAGYARAVLYLLCAGYARAVLWLAVFAAFAALLWKVLPPPRPPFAMRGQCARYARAMRVTASLSGEVGRLQTFSSRRPLGLPPPPPAVPRYARGHLRKLCAGPPARAKFHAMRGLCGSMF